MNGRRIGNAFYVEDLEGKDVMSVTWLAFGTGFFIGCWAGMLILGFLDAWREERSERTNYGGSAEHAE